MSRGTRRVKVQLGIISLLFALATSYTFGRHGLLEPAELCTASLNELVLRYPCAWGGRKYEPNDFPSEARLELRPFSIDGRGDEASESEITVWLTAQKSIQRGNIFGAFGFNKEYFDGITSRTMTADLPAQIDHPSPRIYHLTFSAEGDEWIVSTFHGDSFRPLPDGNGYGATEETWYVHFEPGDTDLPSFSMVCSFWPNCEMQLKENDFSTTVFVSRRLVGERRRIEASVRAITQTIVQGTLSPSELRNPCAVADVCLPDLVVPPLKLQ